MIQSYPWYIADWRNSETRLNLSLAARGLYRELLDYCYMEGSLPTERELLESIAGADGKQTRYCLDTVLKLFVLKEGANGNRYHHPKVDEVRDKLFSYHEQRRHAGVKSGQSRRDRALNGRSGESGTGAEPSPEPAPTPDKNPQTPAPDGADSHKKKRSGKRTSEQVRAALGERTVWFDELWKIGPWTDGKLEGMDAYERRVHDHDLAVKMYKGAKQYASKCAADPSLKVKYLQGWISGERWTDGCDKLPFEPPSIYKKDIVSAEEMADYV